MAWRLPGVSGSRNTPSRMMAAPSDSSVRNARMRAPGSSVGRLVTRQSQPSGSPVAEFGSLVGGVIGRARVRARIGQKTRLNQSSDSPAETTRSAAAAAANSAVISVCSFCSTKRLLNPS